ncbi:histone-lysine N-methyltransferase SETMAR-like [Rhagoletis pomonella]|uniref:histone-lysine N-methyltransferase SETMAR-like n=1 Tax=Rhagoletis pomonella TaxID=28610 RepID=UPI00177D2DFA|nr:histone-lysine N-methyltransferase SETMAR-like [Rhagoletis pomonella]
MEKSELRAVIKYFHLKGLNQKQIIEELQTVLGEHAPSNATVYNWVNEFKRGRISTKDEPRSGRPKEVTTPETVEKVYKIVTQDRRIKLREIADIVNISYERVHNIIHNELGMKKLSARWVPRLLTPLQKMNRMSTSKVGLDMFNRNPSAFLRRFITMDETSIHHYTPESKEQSKQWVERGSSAPKKAKVVASAGKVMASIFWDAQGIIFINYLEKGKTITAEYYSSLLDTLDQNIKQKRPHLKKKKILFHHDNAPSHSSWKTQEKINELGYELLPHPPYSPDLAPSDFFLFPNMKKWLGGKRFVSNSEVIAATNTYFEGFEKTYFREGINMLEKRWKKCIDLKGDYVEK